MSTLNEDLEQIKNNEDNIASSKVARFCYTERAYQDNDYGGVPEFDPSAEQNIPLANPDTLKTNATVLDRGFRSQASSLPRMLINHFFGRVSYNLNKAHDNLVSLITTIKSFIGQPNGIASLDENGRIPYSQLPESALNLIGDWDASTNTPELSDGMEGATLGDMYYVTVGGTVDFGHGEIVFFPNDRIMYNQYNQWVKLSSGNVRKVNNREPNASDGNVTVYGTDINVSEEENMNIIEKMKQYVASTLLGRHWTEVSGITDDFRAPATYANGVWVIGGNRITKKLYYSTNGMNWTAVSITGHFVASATYANGVWVIGSDAYGSNIEGKPYYSTDGMNWTEVSGITGRFVSSATYANGVWVIGSMSATEGKLYYSTDGMNWTAVSGITDDFRAPATYANGVWVIGSGAYGYSTKGKLYYSTDGMNWTASGITDVFTAPATYANGVWVICSATARNSGKLYYSTDGMNWTAVSGITDVFKASATYANGVWVIGSATESNSGKLYYSTDGMNWTASGITGDFTTSATYANGVWVIGSDAYGNNIKGKLYYSTNGMNWTASGITGHFVASATYANGVWVIGSGSYGNNIKGKLYYSTVQDLIDNGWVK